MAFDKKLWLREQRRKFQVEHGYSTNAHYDTGGLRQQVLERDRYACVRCGMTDAEHKARWSRPITIDHKDKDKTHNTLANLQTLCLSCHGRKDILPRLTIRRVAQYREVILLRRAAGDYYQDIADDLGFSIAAIWRWVKRWESEEAEPCP